MLVLRGYNIFRYIIWRAFVKGVAGKTLNLKTCSAPLYVLFSSGVHQWLIAVNSLVAARSHMRMILAWMYGHRFAYRAPKSDRDFTTGTQPRGLLFATKNAIVETRHSSGRFRCAGRREKKNSNRKRRSCT